MMMGLLAVFAFVPMAAAFSFITPPTLPRTRHRRYVRPIASTVDDTDSDRLIPSTVDVIIVGSGIGGLSCAAMLSFYGYSVAVFESHYAPGGAAHGFRITDRELNGEFVFDTGPSFFSGLNPYLPAKPSNPLRMILDTIGEKVECIPYETFGLKFPEGDFIHTPNFGGRGGTLDKVSGEKATKGWKSLMKNMEPLADAVAALPTAALRGDIGVLLTATPFLKNFASLNPLENLKLTKPFQSIVNGSVTDSFTRNWLDLLCFCLSGMPASGTITAEMAMMMGEFYEVGALMDCPKGGARAIVDALVRGIEKQGGAIYYNSHVQEIIIQKGRATGVRLKKGNRMVRAKKAVVSNLSVWDLFGSGLVDTSAFPRSFVKDRMDTPVGKSFMHMHIGFRATKDELKQLEAHYMYVDEWSKGVEAEDGSR
jgi:phytoene dehydrogenase-like protein